MLKQIILSASLAILSFSCLGQYNVYFGQQNGAEKIYEVESCDGITGLYVGWHPSSYGFSNGRLFYGTYNLSDGVRGEIDAYPVDGRLELAGSLTDVELVAYRQFSDGPCTGYAVAISLRSAQGTETLRLLRIDLNGDLISQTNTTMGSGISGAVHGLIYSAAGTFIAVGSFQDPSSPRRPAIFEFNGTNGALIRSVLINYDFDNDSQTDGFEARDIIELEGSQTTAKYAVACRSSNTTSIIGVDDNFIPVSGYSYDIDGLPNPEVPEAMVERDGILYVAGSAPNKGTLVALNSVSSNTEALFNHKWTVDLIARGGNLTIKDIDRSATDGVVLAGWSTGLPFFGLTNSRGLILHVDPNGVVKKTNSYNSESLDNYHILDVDYIPSLNGHIATGWGNLISNPLNLRQRLILTDDELEAPCIERVRVISKIADPKPRSSAITWDPSRVRGVVSQPPSLQNIRRQQLVACSQNSGCIDTEEVCQTGSIDITTGFNQTTNQTHSFLTPDAEWVLTQTPLGQNVTVPFLSQSIEPYSEWDLKLNSTGDYGTWISPFGNAAFTEDNTIPYVFERCFCLCSDDTVRFDMATAVDDLLDLELWEKDGSQITTLQSFSTGYKFHKLWPFTETISLTEGSYCLKANVYNDGGKAMGFYATGTVSSPSLVEDACCKDSFLISGIKLVDSNCSGQFEANGNSDAGAPNSPITIYQQGTTNVVWTGTTDQNGYFSAQVPLGSYDVATSTILPSQLVQPIGGVFSVDVSYDETPPFLVFGEKDPENCDCLFTDIYEIPSDNPSSGACCYRVNLDNQNGLYYDAVEVASSGGTIVQTVIVTPYAATQNNGIISITSSTQGQLLGDGKFSIDVCFTGLDASETLTIDWIKTDTSVCQELDLVSCGCAISAIGTISNTAQDSCCTASVSFQNDFAEEIITKVGFELVFPSLESTYFDEFSLSASAGYTVSDITTTSFTLESANGTPIPDGAIDDVISFCFGDSLYSSNSQFIALAYYDEDCEPLKSCADTLEYDCPIRPIDFETCNTAELISATCDAENVGIQTVSLLVSNYSGNEVTGIKVFGFSGQPVNYEFDLSSNPITASTDGSESTMITFDISTAGLTLPMSFPLYVTTHAVIDDKRVCCTRQVEISLALCCDPCSSDWLSAIPDSEDSCCTGITVDNTCDDELRRVTATVLGGGAFFNSVSINSVYSNDWVVGSSSGPDFIEAEFTTGGFAPSEEFQNLFTFCMRDTVGNGIEFVQIDYVGTNDSVLCTEIIEVYCEREPQCLAVVRDTVYCDTDGNYFMDLTFQSNVYPEFTGDLLFIDTEPSGTTSGLGIAPPFSFGAGLSPNGFFDETYAITGTPQSGDQLLLSTQLQSSPLGQGVDTCCYDDNILLVTLPTCIGNSCCRDYEIFYQAVQSYVKPYSPCDTARIRASRLDTCMYSTIDWGDGSVSTNQGPLQTEHVYAQPGVYNVCIRFGESTDDGQSFCWESERCDIVNIQSCSGPSIPLCDTLNQPATRFFGWAAVTCSAYDDYGNPAYNGGDDVLGLIDIRNHPAAPVGSNWGNAPMYHGPAGTDWTANNLGNIFGLALDPAGNIYTSFFGLYSRRVQTSSTQHFGSLSLNPLQRPSIFRVDPVSGQVFNIGDALASTHSVSAEGIYLGYGNLAYNPVNRALWLTNLGDNKLYAINPITGAILLSYDPFDGLSTPGKVFGIGYNPTEHRIYYSVWRMNTNNTNSGENEIYSIALSPQGQVAGVPVLEWTATEIQPSLPYSNPVLDISFSTDGNLMLVSERSLQSLPGSKITSWSHKSRHLRFSTVNSTSASGNWVLDSSDPYQSVSNSGDNSAGGGDFTYKGPKFDSCDAIVVLSEDYIRPSISSSLKAYGIRGVDADGGTVANSWFVDLDGVTNRYDKFEIGDVEVFRELCCTSRPAFDYCDDVAGWEARRAGVRVDFFEANRIATIYWPTPIAADMVDIDWGDGKIANNVWPSDFPVRHVYRTVDYEAGFQVRFKVLDENGEVCLETTETFEVTPVEEVANEEKILVYPNPFSNQLRISSKGLNAEIIDVTLHNMTGQEMSVFLLPKGQSEHVLNTQALAPGMYVVRARLSNGSIASSMVVHLE